MSDGSDSTMVRKIEGKTQGSLFQRALADGVKESAAISESESAAGPLSGDARAGWDPFEVWLRRVHQPRSRAEREPSSD